MSGTTIGELFPPGFTPIGDLGLQYHIQDVEIEYTYGGFSYWSGTVVMKAPKGWWEHHYIIDAPLNQRDIARRIWEVIYLYEKKFERWRASESA